MRKGPFTTEAQRGRVATKEEKIDITTKVTKSTKLIDLEDYFPNPSCASSRFVV
jgi:hypothetical protein